MQLSCNTEATILSCYSGQRQGLDQVFRRELRNSFVRLFRSVLAALRAVSADFQPADHDVKPAITLDLPFEPVEKVAFQFADFPAPQAGHVDVVTLRPALIVVFLALHVHQIKFIDQTVALE